MARSGIWVVSAAVARRRSAETRWGRRVRCGGMLRSLAASLGDHGASGAQPVDRSRMRHSRRCGGGTIYLPVPPLPS
jgi:hypothetical protein